MKLPNFLIIGSAKCGTTSLAAYLNQHPQVFMSVPKEPTFFGSEGTSGLFNGPHDEDRAYHSRVITTIEQYQALFDGVKEEKAIGEASIFYLYFSKAPEQIQKYVPQAKMFAVLRNPADRAYSAYLHTVRQARERRSFEEALQLEPERIRKNWNSLWHFKAMGFYYEQIKRYFDRFGREQVRVYLYEDMQQKPLELIKEILEILELDSSSFIPDMSRRFKESYVPQKTALEMFVHQTQHKIIVSRRYLPGPVAWRTKYLVSALDRVAAKYRTAPPRMREETRAALLNDYRDDILRLSDLLRRDLTHWCNPVPAEVVGAR